MDTTHREHFTGFLFGLFQLISIISIIPGVRPTVKWIAFVVLSWISYHLITKTTTQDLAADLGLGSAILTQLLIAFDLMFITHPDTLTNFQDSHTGKITERPFKERALWAYNLYTNPRGIGWAHESPHLPSRPSPSTLPWKFVCVRIFRALLYIILECIAYVLNASNPGMTTPSVPLSHSALHWRALGVIGFGVAGYARINMMHCLLSAGVVACGFSTPERWPNIFGSPLQAWSVQQFWRKVWHQMLRKPVIAFTTLTMSKIFRIRTRTHRHQANISNIIQNSLWLLTAFFIVGIIHIGGEYMLIGRMGSGAFKFFVLQAAAIMLEKVVASGWAYFNPSLDIIDESDARTKQQNGKNGVKNSFPDGSNNERSRGGPKAKSEPPIWIRCVGYVWVFLWLVWSLAFMIDPMVPTGMFIDDFRSFAWSLFVIS
ncbi:hypothetical protein M413DRAFT_19814 [Hebeloma cylindrosporum]|uniref:Wax synthase domain-containing protein n=1 Tax=Hebeloma cylindrosporum TaxID=76867 RepID=A0A0C3C4U6_HEBCY|nr:hypothetical protein M413DRAFT_19814 [Hebeloma cylindrosporum h7]